MYVIYPTAPYLGNIDVYVYIQKEAHPTGIYICDYTVQQKENEKVVYEIHR